MLTNESLNSIDTKDEFGTNHKDRGGREHDVLDAVAGPSNISAAVTKLKKRKSKSSGTATPVPLDKRKSPAFAEPPSFENNGEFIAFGPEEDEPDLSREDKEAMGTTTRSSVRMRHRARHHGSQTSTGKNVRTWLTCTRFYFFFCCVEANDTLQITPRSRCVCEIHLPDA
jgi:hypothetical protein